MGIKQTNGTYLADKNDQRNKAINDLIHGKTTQVAGLPAADQADYAEAYQWASWFNLQFNRPTL